jgi:hypothetical protein
VFEWVSSPSSPPPVPSVHISPNIGHPMAYVDSPRWQFGCFFYWYWIHWINYPGLNQDEVVKMHQHINKNEIILQLNPYVFMFRNKWNKDSCFLQCSFWIATTSCTFIFQTMICFLPNFILQFNKPSYLLCCFLLLWCYYENETMVISVPHVCFSIVLLIVQCSSIWLTYFVIFFEPPQHVASSLKPA